MKHIFRSFVSLIGTLAFAIIAPLVYLIGEAFPFSPTPLGHLADTGNTEVADRQSQTGKGVWDFVTDLFSREGRTYTWQAGTIG